MIDQPMARPLAHHELGDNDNVNDMDVVLAVNQEDRQTTPTNWI